MLGIKSKQIEVRRGEIQGKMSTTTKIQKQKPMLATKLWVSSFICVELLSQASYGCKNLSGRMLDLRYK